MKISDIFPEFKDVMIVRTPGHFSKRYGLSAWLGLSQPILNTPRLFIYDLVKGVRLLLVGVFMFSYHVFVLGILRNVVMVLALIILGLLGRIHIRGDKQLEGTEYFALFSKKEKKESKE